MRVFQSQSQEAILGIMRSMNVDPCGIKIMLPKALAFLVLLDNIPWEAAIILKQQMLSLGAEAALPRSALRGSTRKTKCLLMGNLSQFERLCPKLLKQPFGLPKISVSLSLTLKNYLKPPRTLKMGNGDSLKFNGTTRVMGIMNLTPDSFSCDGLYRSIDYKGSLPLIVEAAEKMQQDGADIIDLGGESSRPGAQKVPLKEELKRTIPVIKAITKRLKIPLSIDTRKPEVARAAVENGVSIINDINGLRDLRMLTTVASCRAAVVIMHMQGDPDTMQDKPVYANVSNDIIQYLADASLRAQEAGILPESIVIDPGICFGKTVEHNLQLLNNLREFKVLGKPVLVGTSRKSFIGKLLNEKDAQKRLAGSIASCCIASANGADIVRVHDVKAVRQALIIADSIKGQNLCH